ncbi:MAG TPA: succinylglutamate desuccinylase/aspartoacylase family protein [Candidatus Acidoferrum sp.]|nr:succinylglutamate desuccinylase/aspartoacylase family protein [Candidatus Acidoferrum sp.]
MRTAARSIADVLAPLHLARGVSVDQLGPFRDGDQEYVLPRCTFAGPNSSDPIRIGIFAGIHGDEPAGILAAVEFISQIARDPRLAENYLVRAYPICNPTGFEDNTRASRRGSDLNRCFWKNSAEPEVRLIERELRENRFDGLIQLHADDTSDGLYGFVRGHTLSENLLKPALDAAGKILPRNINAQIDGFAAKDGIIYDGYEGILAAPSELQPPPFEIILETPHHAPGDQQVEALVVAMHSVFAEYRQLIAFAANL